MKLRNIENYDNTDPPFESVYAKAGRKKMNKNSLHDEIWNIMGSDNSFTQIG